MAGLLGLGSLSWAGHQVHLSLPKLQFLKAGVDPKELPLPHEFLLNRDLLAQLYPTEGATPFFTLNWSKYAEFLTFRGGLDPVTGGLWLTDIAHRHLAIAFLFLVAGHMYRTNFGIGHRKIFEILDSLERERESSHHFLYLKKKKEGAGQIRIFAPFTYFKGWCVRYMIG